MTTKVVAIGEHMPLSTRRVVMWCGKSTGVETAIGRVEGMADGVVMIRTKHGECYEITPEAAKELSDAIRRAALGVEQWQRAARGYYEIRVTRSDDGVVTVYAYETERTMRLSRLRGGRHVCAVCREMRWATIYVAQRNQALFVAGFGHGRFPQVCASFVERLANAKEPDADVIQWPAKGTSPAP